MKKRIISALLIIPPVVFIFYLGGPWLFLLLLAATVAAYNELNNLVANLSPEVKTFKPLGYAGIFLLLTGFYFHSYTLFIISITFLLLISVVWQLICKYESKFFELGVTILCIFYIVWSFGFLLAIRNLPDGFYLVLLLLLIIWGTDTGAYFFGLLLGKRKLAPNISPNKTVEGSIGGGIVSVLVSIIFGVSIGFSILLALFIGVIISVTAQLGDLMQSVLKRKANIKDSGELIPGHGGILDRFDSFLLSPAVFYLILILMGV